MAVRIIQLEEPTFPASIDIPSHKRPHPNLKTITFWIPTQCAVDSMNEPIYLAGCMAEWSRIHIYHAPQIQRTAARDPGGESEDEDEDEEGEEEEDSSTGDHDIIAHRRRLLGDLEIVCDCTPDWNGVDFYHPAFALFGMDRRYKLTALSVGPAINLQNSLPGHEEWSKLGLVIGAPAGTDHGRSFKPIGYPRKADRRELLQDVQILQLNCTEDRQQLAEFLPDMRSLRCLSVNLERTSRQTAGLFQDLKALLFRPWNPTCGKLEKLELFAGSQVFTSYPRLHHSLALTTLSIPYQLVEPEVEDRCETFNPEELVYPRYRTTDFLECITLCVPRTACILNNTMKLAWYLAKEFPSAVKVDIKPLFFEPEVGELVWMEHVLENRQMLFNMANKSWKAGFRHVPAQS